MTDVTPWAPGSAGPPASFADAVRSEGTKFRTLRSARYTLLAVLVLAFGFAVLFSAGAGNMWTKRSPADQVGFDPANVSLLGGVLLTQLAIGVLGVLIVASEYGTGMIRSSLTTVPRRGRLLGAKALVFAVVALVTGQVAAFGAILLGQAVLSSVDAPHTSLGAAGVPRAVIGGGVYLLLVGLLGVACGFLIRSTAGAITTTIAVTLVLPLMLGFLPETISRYYPIVAGQRVMVVVPDGSGLGPWTGLGIMVVTVLLLFGVAYAVFEQRDA
ncbi:ABC transporter permease [Micromonospora sp. NBC_00617]|uniref:ABC transporter permease n=1 Tax=Micromonospora sp. NBC_00617 TaxID=2903587 RepID=UPI0030E0706B